MNNAARYGVGAVGGGLATFGVTRTELAQKVIDAFLGVLRDHGLPVALVVVFVVATLLLTFYLLRELIRSKDGEINRLVDQRDQLWDQVIKNRPRSGAGPKP